MVQNKNISKKILDASWQELLRQMKYKSKWLGKEVFQIDSYYPSSQIFLQVQFFFCLEITDLFKTIAI